MRSQYTVINNKHGVFVDRKNGPMFEVKFFLTKKDNLSLARFIKDKMERAYKEGFSDRDFESMELK
jgi:hypothetical protein